MFKYLRDFFKLWYNPFNNQIIQGIFLQYFSHLIEAFFFFFLTPIKFFESSEELTSIPFCNGLNLQGTVGGLFC